MASIQKKCRDKSLAKLFVPLEKMINSINYTKLIKKSKNERSRIFLNI